MGGRFSVFWHGGLICSRILLSICSRLCPIPKKVFNLVMGRVCSRFCACCCYNSKEIKDLKKEKKEVRLSAQTIKDTLENAELENDGTTRRVPFEDYKFINKQLNNILERCEEETRKYDKELQVWFHADMKSEATTTFYEAFEKLMKDDGVKLTEIGKEDIRHFYNVITICNVYGREGENLNPITGVEETLRKRLFLIVVLPDTHKSGTIIYIRDMFANVVEIMFDKDKGLGGITDIDKDRTLLSEINKIF